MDKLTFEKLKRRSSKAVCGAFEKEVIVKKENLNKAKQILKDKGFVIVGSGDTGFGKKKLWYNPAGLYL